MNIRKRKANIFIYSLCFLLFFSNISISVNAGNVATMAKVGKFMVDMGKVFVSTGVGKVAENLVDKWFSGDKKYYDSPGNNTTMDYYANNSAINKATGNISNSGANNENCYNSFSSTVTSNRTFSLIKDSYNSTTNNYTSLLYNPITNNYTELSSTSNIYHNEQYQTYFIENNEYNYYVTNNYTYVSYFIINNETNEDSYYEIYYEMPDGRNSYNLEKEDIWGEYFIYDVVGYESVQEDDGKTLALYHFDGDGKDSSYWKNNDASLGSGVFTDGKFGQGIIVSPNTQVRIDLKNELDVEDFTLEMTLLNTGSLISGVSFMVEDTIYLASNSILNSGINSLVFQGGAYDTGFPDLPINDVYYHTYSTAKETLFFEGLLKFDSSKVGKPELNFDTTFYCNGGKKFFISSSSNEGVLCNYKCVHARSTSGGFHYYDLVSIEKYLPNTVGGTGIYIFKDSIVINNTSSQSFILDELRVSNCKLYDTDTISVPTQPFDTNQVLALPEKPSKNMIAVQGKYAVSDFRVGGVRPTYPTQGFVYVYLEDDVVKDIQQFEGDAWYSVNGAIYRKGEWSDLIGLNLSDLTYEVDEDVGDNSGDNSGDNNDDSGVNSDDSGGSGVGDLVGGIGKILDTLLSLIGKVMGVVADFTQSVLDLFSGFTTFTDGFSSFLSGAFGFIPAEIWNLVSVGLSLMVLLAVVKFLRK